MTQWSIYRLNKSGARIEPCGTPHRHPLRLMLSYTLSVLITAYFNLRIIIVTQCLHLALITVMLSSLAFLLNYLRNFICSRIISRILYCTDVDSYLQDSPSFLSDPLHIYVPARIFLIDSIVLLLTGYLHTPKSHLKTHRETYSASYSVLLFIIVLFV